MLVIIQYDSVPAKDNISSSKIISQKILSHIHVQAVKVTWPGARKKDTVAPKDC